MIDRKKVIRGLTVCTDNTPAEECWKCPYKDKEYCTDAVMQDALALLREQETGHWIFLTDCSNSGVYCSECSTKVFDRYPFKKKFSYFCPHCGTRMEGEVERL